MKIIQSEKVSSLLYNFNEFSSEKLYAGTFVLRIIEQENHKCYICGFQGHATDQVPSGFMHITSETEVYDRSSRYRCVCPFCLPYSNFLPALGSRLYIPVYTTNFTRVNLANLYQFMLPVLSNSTHDLYEDAKKINDTIISMSSNFVNIFDSTSFVGQKDDVNRIYLMMSSWLSRRGEYPRLQSLLESILLVPDVKAFKYFGDYYKGSASRLSDTLITDKLVEINV